MRDEFYGDRRDLWKWTIALREAHSGRKILHVAMLHPAPRRLRQMPRDIDERVWEFFKKEWECLDAETSRCSRIARLGDEVKLISSPFDNKRRSQYFGSVVTTLASRSRDERYVVLLDPDTGIAGSKATSKHICADDVKTVWGAMRTGDVLLILPAQRPCGKATLDCRKETVTGQVDWAVRLSNKGSPALRRLLLRR